MAGFLPTFRDNLSVPSSRVKQSKENSYAWAEAWDHVSYFLYIKTWTFKVKFSQCVTRHQAINTHEWKHSSILGRFCPPKKSPFVTKGCEVVWVPKTKQTGLPPPEIELLFQRVDLNYSDWPVPGTLMRPTRTRHQWRSSVNSAPKLFWLS